MIIKWRLFYFYKCAIIGNGYTYHLIKPRDLLNAGYSKPKITIKNGKRYIKISGMSYKTLIYSINHLIW